MRLTPLQIKAIGNLLQNHESDLTYIVNFQNYKNGTGTLSESDYLKKKSGTFKSFIDEYRVARNIDRTKTSTLLELTMEWVKEVNCNDVDNVDAFAIFLNDNKITHGRIMTSLASKILFLNNPWAILPLDALAKKAVNLRNNNYADFFPLTAEYIVKNDKSLKCCLASVEEHLTIIERIFENKIKDIRTITNNRFVDKMLWTIGREKLLK